MKLKTLAAACLAVSLSSFTVASAETDLCAEIEGWIIEGLNEPPFPSLDPAFKSEDNGSYLPGRALETLDGEPCRLRRTQPDYLEKTKRWVELFCPLPIKGEARGGRRDAKAAYRALRERIVKCPVLQDWKMTEKDEFSDSSISWTYQGTESIQFELRTENQYTTSSNTLELSLLRLERDSDAAAAGAGDWSFPARTANPRGMAQWGGQIAGAYPEIARRLGWPVLDHTACKNMERYARFEPVVDNQGNPAEGKFSTRIAYRLD